jgi:hypothetical protein
MQIYNGCSRYPCINCIYYTFTCRFKPLNSQIEVYCDAAAFLN